MRRMAILEIDYHRSVFFKKYYAFLDRLKCYGNIFHNVLQSQKLN